MNMPAPMAEMEIGPTTSGKIHFTLRTLGAQMSGRLTLEDAEKTMAILADAIRQVRSCGAAQIGKEGAS